VLIQTCQLCNRLLHNFYAFVWTPAAEQRTLLLRKFSYQPFAKKLSSIGLVAIR
jgi:hypothetical protein